MAWDDTAPTTAEFQASAGPKWDSAPPTAGELASLKASAAPAEPPKDWIDTATSYLPAAGGLLGGIAGLGGASIPGATAGAIGGSALKNLINEYRHPEAPKVGVSDDLIEGAKSGIGQTIGEKIIAPVVGPVFNSLAKPLADYFSKKFGNFAANQAVRATGAAGATVYNKFPENAGRELLDRGIVGFGDTQGSIAAKATGALAESGKGIGSALEGLESQGATVPKAGIIQNLRDRAAELMRDPAQMKVGQGLSDLADKMEGQAAVPASQQAIDTGLIDGAGKPIMRTAEVPGRPATSAVPDDIPITQAETSKKVFQTQSKYGNNVSPYDQSVSKEAAGVYRQAVEDSATQMDPSLASQFQADKQSYGVLAPIEEATAKRAAALAQKQGPNMHALGGMGVGSLVGGEEGYRHGGLPGAAAGTALGAFLGARALSSTAVGADKVSQFLAAAPGMAPGVAGQAAGRSYLNSDTTASADKIGDLVRTSPQSLGRWAPSLQAAAQRGETALAATSAVLQQTDAGFREHMRKLFGDGND